MYSLAGALSESLRTEGKPTPYNMDAQLRVYHPHTRTRNTGLLCIVRIARDGSTTITYITRATRFVEPNCRPFYDVSCCTETQTP